MSYINIQHINELCQQINELRQHINELRQHLRYQAWAALDQCITDAAISQWSLTACVKANQLNERRNACLHGGGHRKCLAGNACTCNHGQSSAEAVRVQSSSHQLQCSRIIAFCCKHHYLYCCNRIFIVIIIIIVIVVIIIIIV